MRENDVFIFAMGRSGGSALQHSLDAAINFDKKFEAEIFSDEEEKEKIIKNECSVKHILKRLKKLQDEMGGLKLNMHNLYFCEGKDRELNQEIIDYFGRVIFNGRYNFLKMEISARIAVKTDMWDIVSPEERKEKIENVDTWSIDINDLKDRMEAKRRDWEYYKNYAKHNNIPYLEVSYEQLFGKEDVEHRISVIKDIVEWLGFEFDNEHLGNIKELLDPNRKVNKKETYLLIDNIKEINRVLGPEFGYLF